MWELTLLEYVEHVPHAHIFGNVIIAKANNPYAYDTILFRLYQGSKAASNT